LKIIQIGGILKENFFWNFRLNFLSFVFQGVYDQFEMRAHLPWEPEESKNSKFVFIGKELNVKNIINVFSKFNEGVELKLQRMDNMEASPAGWKFLVILLAWVYFVYPEKFSDLWQTIQSNNLYFFLFMSLFTVFSLGLISSIRGKKKKRS
jgi:hypothetical protein